MGFELTEGAVFYIVIMLIVVFIGIAIVAGVNPRDWFKSESPLSRLFEPGRLTESGGSVGLNCEGAAYILTLKQANFYYGGKPGGKTDTVDFVAMMERDGKNFIGHETTGDLGVAKIECASDENGPGSTCPPKDIEFNLQGIGAPGGEQTFHFTLWRYNDALINAVADSSMDELLDTYSNFYVSSFDKTFRVEEKCLEDRCKKATAQECDSIDGCYLSGLPWSTCNICPTYTTCSAYDSTQCTKCPFPRSNCEPGTLWGCNPRG